MTQYAKRYQISDTSDTFSDTFFAIVFGLKCVIIYNIHKLQVVEYNGGINNL